MFCSFYLILYIIWFQFSLSLSPFDFFDYYEHQYFTSVLFHMFSFIKNALFGSYSWMSHRTFIESSAVTTAFWLDQYGGRFASIFRRCPASMFWGQCPRYLYQTLEGLNPVYSKSVPAGTLILAVTRLNIFYPGGALTYESDVRVPPSTSDVGVFQWQIASKRGSFSDKVHKNRGLSVKCIKK